MTRSASSSSRDGARTEIRRIVAVAPAPATTTSTVTIAPIWVTIAGSRAGPGESPWAPNSTSNTLKVNTSSTVNGMDSISVGTMDTRATNQLCRMNSRQANGGLNIRTKVSNDMAKNPPTERMGF